MGSWVQIPLDVRMSAFILHLYCPVYVAALGRADPPFYQLSQDYEIEVK
jgi:hypothetical protein